LPGIAGMIRRPVYDGMERDLHSMVDAMRHAPDYSSAEYRNEELGVYVGWTGHKGSFADCMPLVSQRRDIVLIFHGESYRNTQDTGVDGSNARYLINLYAERGENFLRELNGWYSGVIVDLRTQQITLFNDRYGMGRVYVYRGTDEFLFASEAKSLLKIRPELRDIHPAALAESFRFNCVTGHKTLFRGVSLLPAASAWQFDGSAQPRKRRYFDFMEWENQPTLKPGEFYPKFSETLSRVVPLYARESPNVAVSLTAGLDTRAIVAALGPHGSFPCYTFGGRWGELYDIRTARRIAAIYNQSFNAITISDRFLREFSDFARRAIYISDGTHDAFGAHDVYFNEEARGIAPVRLTGKFGSEVVRVRNLVGSISYPPHFFVPAFRESTIDRLPSFAELSGVDHPLTRVVAAEIPWHEFGRVAVEQSQVILRTPYMDNDLVRLMFQTARHVRAAGDLQDRYVRDNSPELSRVPTNLGRFVTSNRLATRVLYGLMRSLFKVEYVYLYATPHWMTRVDRKLKGLRLERILAGRQKWEGYRIWIKTDFADFIRDVLLDPAAHYRRFLERRTVEEMVTRHIAGTHNYLTEINRALTLELIYASLLKP
jgi:asparagine synthase (glutamine-hydrolysing)